MRRSALLTASAFIGLASIVAAGSTASASARASIAPKAAAVSTFTLNLVGTPIVVGVTTDPAGNLVDATVTPATGFTPTAVMPNKVRFENSTTGTTVSVKANHGGQSVTARASSLATLVSTANGWSGDVFGNGTTTKVTFDIAALALDGVSPDILKVKVLPDCTTGVAPAMTCVVGPTTYGDDEDDNEGTEASASVKFSLLGQTRTLRIRVGTHTEDGVTSASVRISLSKIKGGMTVVVGTAQTWTGTLCDGKTVATFGYLVDATTGAVTITAPSPTAEVKNNENGAEVRFANGPRVRIGVKHEDDGGGAAVPSLTVKFKCEAGIPTIGGLPADPTIVNQGGHGDQGGHGGGDGGNNNGGGDNKGND